jgi:hypothetical protein
MTLKSSYKIKLYSKKFRLTKRTLPDDGGGRHRNMLQYNFHIHTVHLDIIKDFRSPTDAQVNFLKNNIKM